MNGKQILYTHTMEHHSALKQKEVLTDAATGTMQKCYALERSQTQKATCGMNPFIGKSHNRPIYSNRKLTTGYQNGRKGAT